MRRPDGWVDGGGRRLRTGGGGAVHGWWAWALLGLGLGPLGGLGSFGPSSILFYFFVLINTLFWRVYRVFTLYTSL